jgi:hypothetical protein
LQSMSMKISIFEFFLTWASELCIYYLDIAVISHFMMQFIRKIAVFSHMTLKFVFFSRKLEYYVVRNNRWLYWQ